MLRLLPLCPRLLPARCPGLMRPPGRQTLLQAQAPRAHRAAVRQVRFMASAQHAAHATLDCPALHSPAAAAEERDRALAMQRPSHISLLSGTTSPTPGVCPSAAAELGGDYSSSRHFFSNGGCSRDSGGSRALFLIHSCFGAALRVLLCAHAQCWCPGFPSCPPALGKTLQSQADSVLPWHIEL